MEHIPTRGGHTALFALGALALLGTLTYTGRAVAQEAPPPEGYAPPEQVYTVDVYEQTYAPPPTVVQPQPQPAARPRRVVIPYEDGMPVPEGAYVRSRSRKGLWIPGLAIFAASYFFTGGIGALVLEVMDEPDNRIWVPLAGPFLVTDRDTARPGAVMSMLFQSAGLAMLIAGLASRRRELVYYTDNGRGLTFGLAPTRGGAMVSLNVF